MTTTQANIHTASKVWQAFKKWREACNEYKGITRSDFEQELAAVCGVDVNRIKDLQRCGGICGRFYPVELNREGLALNYDDFIL